jgi:hypothetical protein
MRKTPRCPHRSSPCRRSAALDVAQHPTQQRKRLSWPSSAAASTAASAERSVTPSRTSSDDRGPAPRGRPFGPSGRRWHPFIDRHLDLSEMSGDFCSVPPRGNKELPMGARASSQGLRALERPEFAGSVHAADGAECFVYNHVRLGFDESGEFVVVSGANVVVEIVDRHMDAACIELRPADALRLAALLLAHHENHDVGLRPLEHDQA